MPSAATHRNGAAVAVGLASVGHDLKNGPLTPRPALDAALAYCLGRLPDFLEPAHHPNHRDLFHSWMVFAGLGYGLHRAYQWQPEEDWQHLLKWLSLIAGGAYATHLLMDATTDKSLPLV